MSGELIRAARTPHRCKVPTHAQRGDIWACECRRRWKCVDPVTRRENWVTLEADWRRRWLPWPRLPKPDAEREVT